MPAPGGSHARCRATLGVLSRRARLASDAWYPVHRRRWTALGAGRADTLRSSSTADGLARSDAVRVFVGRQTAPGRHHEDGQFLSTQTADRGSLELSAYGQ